MLKLLLLITIVGLALSAPSNDSEDELIWTSTYSVKVLKMTLNSGLKENIETWYDEENKKVRIDYNNGIVKKIFNFDEDVMTKYKVRPETTETETNVFKCNKATIESSDNAINNVNILPSTDGFVKAGTENIEDVETIKFSYKYVDEDVDTTNILWARYDPDVNIWIPVRYEEFQYYPWVGSLSKHIYWEYYDFTTVVDSEYFDINDDECVECEECQYEEEDFHDLKFTNMQNNEHVDRAFKIFKRKFNRTYEHEAEHSMRRQIFQNSIRLVAATNRMNLGYKLTVNQFSDRTESEMKQHMGLLRHPASEVGTIPFPYKDDEITEAALNLPEEFDLRDLGVISPVRDQASCGSCWSFGATASVEGALARVNGGRLLHLSEQALIDCTWGFDNTGCDGGYAKSAYKWIMKHGIPTEEEYGSYIGQEGLCQIDNITETYKIRGYSNVTPYSVNALKVALVNHGPVSVSIHLSERLQAYSSGIFYDPTCKKYSDLDHEVALIGYGAKYGEPYWIIRNSWGPQWGENGYLRISTRDNDCGITTDPTFVVV